MSDSVNKMVPPQGLSSSPGMAEETTLMQKQGIVTVLGSDYERNRATVASLRRTLSADMSSKKWLSQNGISPMKKIASSEELLLSQIIADSLSSSEGDDDCGEREELEREAEVERSQLEIWNSIQRDKNIQQEEKPGQFDIWSSIISQKPNDDASKSLPPYIHPLVKRSQSSLSEKSLKICTESLGSETGSDGFSSYPPSETGDAEEDKEDEQEQQQTEKFTVQAYEAEEEDFPVPKHNYAAASRKPSPRSFPPPLPSLSRKDAPSLHMRSHRDSGRLVLEAVSVPSQHNFLAQRQDGRLVLTFTNHSNDEESKEDAEEAAEEQGNDHMEEMEEQFGEFEEDDQEEKENEEDECDETEDEEIGEIETDETDIRDVETVIEQAATLSSAITGVHRLALMMHKPIEIVNRNPSWSEKFNEVVNFEDVKEVESTTLAQSLPPRPRLARLIPSTPAAASAAAAAAASFNAYEYYWRTNPTSKAAPVPNSLSPQRNISPLKNTGSKLIVSGDINQLPNEQQQLLVLRGKNGDYLVHNLKSCKESRRSFLFWEPYCIATS